MCGATAMQFRLALAGRVEELPSPGGGFEKRVVIGVTGGLFFEPEVRTPSLADAALVGLGRSLQVINGTIEGVAAIVKSQISACNLQGPVGIAQVSAEGCIAGRTAIRVAHRDHLGGDRVS